MQHAKKYVLVDPVMYSRTLALNPISSIPTPSIAKNSRLDSEVRFLEGDEPDDVKAKHHAMVLKKFRVREPAQHIEDAVDETEIVDSVPTTVRHRAKRLSIFKENPHLAWNARGELIYNQSVVSGSSIVELFNDILRHRRVGDERPSGWREFSEDESTSLAKLTKISLLITEVGKL